MKRILMLIGATFASAQAAEEVADPNCQPLEYSLKRNTVFDPDEEGYTWFHELGNDLHVVTRELTIQTEIDSFELCSTDSDELYEVERHLRNKRYFRDAEVSADEDGKVVVETWDTWSLLPVIEFSRSAGENEYAVGIKDSNLIGYGVDTQLLYFDDSERSGFELDLRSPLYGWDDYYGDFALADTEDGNRHAVQVYKPFFSKRSRDAMGVGFNFFKRDESLDQNDEETNRFQHKKRHYHGWTGFAPTIWSDQTLRYRVGYFREKHEFARVDTRTSVLPQDRKLDVVWGGVSWQQDRYQRTQNIFLINTTEDLNLGWTAEMKLGWSFSSDEEGEYIEVKVNKGYQVAESLLWLSDFYWLDQPNNDRQSHFVSVKNEFYWSLNDALRWYNKIHNRWGDQLPVDTPIVLDGFNGLRGYPSHYQHGEFANLFTSELRYYPNISLWQIAELAGTVFYDAGRAGGDDPYGNNPKGTLQSVGLGFRLYISHGGRNVLHLDFAKPISSNDNVDGWEWRASARTRF